MRSLRPIIATVMLVAVAVLAGCSSSGPKRGGGYYKDDGPGSSIPANIQAIPDAVPRIESHAPANLKPYLVFGVRYVPISDDRSFRQEGTASWYGRKFHGNKTANGETYDMYAMTAAHPTLPIPSYARVTRAGSQKSVIVRINDRGPFHRSRIIDLSYVAAAKLGLIGPGSGQVIVEAITNADITRGFEQSVKTAAANPIVSPITPVAVVAHPVPDAMAALRSAEAEPDPMVAIRSAPVTTSEHDEQIFLQFGAFSARSNADSVARQLNAQLIEIESRQAQIQADSNLYRVLLGPYPNRTAAVNSALRIQEKTGSQPTVALR